VASNGIDAEKKPYHEEFNPKYDVKDYPMKGSTSADSIALKRIDANTWGEVLKKDGKEIMSGQNAISKDGKTMTRAFKQKNAKGEAFTSVHVSHKQVGFSLARLASLLDIKVVFRRSLDRNSDPISFPKDLSNIQTGGYFTCVS
jgi:hypothetical protein